MSNQAKGTETAHAAEIRQLIRQLTDRYEPVRRRAMGALERYGTEAADALLKEYHTRLQQHHNRHRRIHQWFKCLFYMIAVLCAVCLLLSLAKISFFSIAATVIHMMTFGVIGIINYLFIFDNPKGLVTILDTLSRMRDPRVLAASFQYLDQTFAPASDEFVSVMSRHLSAMTRQEWDNLTPEQREGFYKAVKLSAQYTSFKRQEFVINALKVLEQYGDIEAIPVVEYIARRYQYGRVFDAAKHCLEYLHIRRDEGSIRQTLLRASQANGGKDELLRIPTHVPDMESEQLLRMPQEE